MVTLTGSIKKMAKKKPEKSAGYTTECALSRGQNDPRTTGHPV
jgi:hypothetical protein